MTSPAPAPNNRRRAIAAVLVGLGAIAYGISPIDIIPDVLLPFGFVDDGGVLIGAAVAIYQLLKRRK